MLSKIFLIFFLTSAVTRANGTPARTEGTITAFGSMTPDRQTGLLGQQYDVTNTGRSAATFRILVRNLPTGTTLWNASGTLEGVPYLDLPAPLASGATRRITLEYRSQDRSTVPQPVLEVGSANGSTLIADVEEITSLTVVPAGIAFPGQNLVTVEGCGHASAKYIVEATPDLRTWTPVSEEITAGAGGALRWQTTECPGLTRRYYRFSRPPAFPAATPTGRMTRPVAGGPFIYTTLQGWTVKMDPVFVTVAPPQGNHKYELFGARQEFFGSKHIKNLLGNRRTIVLPGDVIITVTANQAKLTAGANDAVQFVSIYEAAETHRLNLQSYTADRALSLPKYGEATEADGETGRLIFNTEGLRFENISQEGPLLIDSCTGPVVRVLNTVPLGQSFFASPNTINDFFDDPRLAAT
jgi:hypothetical protein